MPIVTEKDSLQYGIEYPAGSGTYHYDFEVRLGTVEDNIEVYEQPDIMTIGQVSNLRINVSMIALCIVSLGSIPKEDITGDLIRTAVDSDFDVMFAAQDRLKKKRLRPSTGSETSVSPEPSSASTASPTNVS